MAHVGHEVRLFFLYATPYLFSPLFFFIIIIILYPPIKKVKKRVPHVLPL